MRLMGKKARVGICIVFGIIFTGFSVSAMRVSDTSQTSCYDTDGNVITCPSAGQPYHGQDANYTINPPSYTKLDASGNALSNSATSWVMVRDNVTGLVWEVKQDKDGTKNYTNPHDADNRYTWYDPDPATNGGNEGAPLDGKDTDDFINALNNANFGGYSDWRMPGRDELRSICDYGRYDPAINTTYFPNVVEISGCFHSSDTFTGYDTYGVWIVCFDSADETWVAKNFMENVRAVRGGQ